MDTTSPPAGARRQPASWDYDCFVARIVHGRGWFPVPKKLLKHLSWPATALLMATVENGRNADDAGWVLASTRYSVDNLGLSEDEDREAVEELQRQRLVDVETRTGRRFLRVNLPRLSALLEGA